jgi:predicted MPP superfamily phosphohydrolase
MSRALTIAVRLAIILPLIGLVHYYIWARLVRDVALPAGMHRALTVLVVALYVIVPSWIWFSRMGDWARPLVWLSFGWTGVLLLLLLTLAFADAGRGLLALVERFHNDGPPQDPERRTVLARMSAFGVLLATSGLSLFALRSGLARVAVRHIEVRLQRLPRELDGATIVQLTDVHVGAFLRRDFIEEIVETTNALSPDVIAITGDLVDGSVAELGEHVAPLGRLKARYGVYFVTGNHEYYSGADQWCTELERLGIRVLRNERVSIGEGETSFDLCGIDDPTGHGTHGHGPDLKKALAGRDATRELVLLAHQPRALFEAVEHGVGLQLSGHTHGGQIWPWSYIVRLQQPVVSGLEKIKDTFIYVSNGTGFWGPPMRLAVPAEITKVLLRA